MIIAGGSVAGIAVTGIVIKKSRQKKAMRNLAENIFDKIDQEHKSSTKFDGWT